MSDTDSFIDEVTEEVRRDRLFGLMRRYGWIAVLAVLVLVGGAAWNEWRKARDTAAAQATGDAMIAALRRDDAQARAEALAALEPESPGARAIVALLAAGDQAEAGQAEAAIARLGALAENADLPLIYRQAALYKKLALQGDDLAPEARRQGYESLVGPGSHVRLLAEEQLALLDAEAGQAEAAIARLQAIVEDEGATAGLRRRATQLIVALGGVPPARSGVNGGASGAATATNGG